MKKNDLTTKNRAELQQSLDELRAKLGQLRFDLADRKIKKTSDIPQVRRQIARIMTALRTAH